MSDTPKETTASLSAWNVFRRQNQDRVDRLIQEHREHKRQTEESQMYGIHDENGNIQGNSMDIPKETITSFPTINVLDHGYVTLVDHMGGDLSIVRAARTSYSAQWRAGEDQGSDHKLINYLWKHKHSTPFEAVTFTFEVKAPIFIFRQWHRHRTWTYNELSARYRELPEEFYTPNPAIIGEQSKNNKQARVINPNSLKGQLGENKYMEIAAYNTACRSAFEIYRVLLESGWPRELARSVLPVSTYSVMQATVNLRNLVHFLHLRLDPHAQWEIQEYARALLKLVEPIVPVAIAAMKSNGDLGSKPE